MRAIRPEGRPDARGGADGDDGETRPAFDVGDWPRYFRTLVDRILRDAQCTKHAIGASGAPEGRTPWHRASAAEAIPPLVEANNRRKFEALRIRHEFTRNAS